MPIERSHETLSTHSQNTHLHLDWPTNWGPELKSRTGCARECHTSAYDDVHSGYGSELRLAVCIDNAAPAYRYYFSQWPVNSVHPKIDLSIAPMVSYPHTQFSEIGAGIPPVCPPVGANSAWPQSVASPKTIVGSTTDRTRVWWDWAGII
jgi:hypothetical protein